jgi:hypothetical protein
MRIWCCKCNKTVNGILTTGKEIYPHRPDLYKKNFYKCPHCGGYVGCHQNSRRPLGCIPTEELKIARMRLHAKMDPLWKSKKITRKELYTLLKNKLGYTYHNGETRTVQECLKVWDILDEIEKELL